MKIKLSVVVFPTNGKDEAELEIVYEDDVVEIKLDGILICSGDWEGNLDGLFQEALEVF